MKIATYNIRNLYDAGTFIDERAENAVQESLFNKRVEHFSSIFKSKDLDIICLQEIGGEEGIKKIAENMGYSYFSAKPNKRGIRTSVLYKKELEGKIKTQSVSLGDLYVPSIHTRGDTSELPPISQRRDVLVIDTIFEDKPLRVVSFHLKSLIPTYLEGDDEEHDMEAHSDAKFRSVFYKMMELRALRSFATKSIGDGKEVIFLGDFNENNNSSGIDVLKSSQEDMYRLYDVLVGYTGSKTTHIHRGNDLTFDTMIVSEWIKNRIASVEVDNKDLKDYSALAPGEIEFVVEADHAMVTISLE
ncbi:MAG: endonuclease/exonuclease/phosphatase family protein [Candidatus Pacebacteria bacterium]|nr:endonuclease/exonuclease/phosphatase family protein [Candidatus Paceibacterota bacterium]